MARYKYAAAYNADKQARAVGRDLSVSMKHAVNVCNFVRSRPVAVAKTMLEEVIALKRPIPYRRYKRDLAHRKGNLTAGRYPAKVTKEVLTVIKSAEANAINKGLNGAALVIRSINVQKASNQWHYSRHRGRTMKRAHVEVLLEESVIKQKAPKKAEKKTEAKPKAESKPAEKKAEAKPAAAEAKPKPEVKKEAQAPKEEKKAEAPAKKDEAPKADAKPAAEAKPAKTEDKK